MLTVSGKKMWQKIVIIVIILMFFQIALTTPTYAIDADVLVEPITALFANLGDGIMEIMQKTFLGIETSGAWIETSNGFWAKFLAIAAVVVIAVVSITAIVLSGGGALAICSAAAGLILKSTVGGIVVYHAMNILHIGEERNLFTRLLFNT